MISKKLDKLYAFPNPVKNAHCMQFPWHRKCSCLSHLMNFEKTCRFSVFAVVFCYIQLSLTTFEQPTPPKLQLRNNESFSVELQNAKHSYSISCCHLPIFHCCLRCFLVHIPNNGHSLASFFTRRVGSTKNSSNWHKGETALP